jgi:hypothetical protein
MALLWATDFLIPTETLIEVIRSKNPITLLDLENYFCVSKWFLQKKLKFLSKRKLIWEVENKIRDLCSNGKCYNSHL